MSVKLVSLCEDQQIACFIRRFLKQCGWKTHEIREVIAPSGQGSGEQWVRERYPSELAAIRGRGGVALIVGTDADTLAVAARIASLDEICRNQNVQPRTPQEPVAMVVPKRNIETWFAYLRGVSVNESDTYPRYPNESDCRGDVRELVKMCNAAVLRQPTPFSLDIACNEYKRLDAMRKKS